MPSIELVDRCNERRAAPLNDAELAHVLLGRAQQQLVDYYFGFVCHPRGGWQEGLLSIFNDGGGTVFAVVGPAVGKTNRSLYSVESWTGGRATGKVNDSTPLIVEPDEASLALARRRRWIPDDLSDAEPGDVILAFEHFVTNWEGDEDQRWSSGGSYASGTVFAGVVGGRGEELLRKRWGLPQVWLTSLSSGGPARERCSHAEEVP